MEIRGNAIAYTGGTTGIPLPTVAPATRRAHTPPAAKKSGIDWDALRPKCRDCGQPSGQLDDHAICPTCRGEEIRANKNPSNVTTERSNTYATLPAEEIQARFTAPTSTPAESATQAKRRGRPATFDHDEAMRRYAAGETASSIAADLGTTRSSIGSVANRRGIHRGQDAHKTPQAADAAPSPSLQEVEPPPDTTAVTAAPAPRPAAPTDELDRQLAHVERVLRTTHDADHPAIRMLRLNVLSAVEALHLLNELTPRTPALPHATAASAGPVEGGKDLGKAKPPSTPRKPRATPTTSRRSIDLTEARRLYLDELKTCPEIAVKLGSTPAGIRRALKADGVTLRDDRAGHSGGRNKAIDDPTVIAQVRQLYTDDELTIDEVANRLDLTHKIVAGIMRRHDIPRRPGAHISGLRPGSDHAVGLKQQMADLGVTSADVKRWALHEGLIDVVRRGIPKQSLVDAYATAHPTPQEDLAS